MSMRHRYIAGKLVLFMLVLVSARAFAYDDVLTFRRSTGGGIEAVVSGKDDECHIPFAPASSVQVSGTAVAITSPYEPRYCPLPRTPVPYQVTADLGVLTGASYQVTWTQGPLQLTGELNPAGVIAPAVAAPTLSSSAIAAMILVLAAASWVARRRRHG